MVISNYWISNSRLPLWLKKPDHSMYLQTWHGTPLKKLAADMDEVHMPGTTTKKYKKTFYWKLKNGYPRNDSLITDNNTEYVKHLKTKFNLPNDKKVILYAPTWRDDQFYEKGKYKYKFDLDSDLELLKNKLGENYIVILRMHYLIAENFDLSRYEGFVYDFSNHEDTRDLYLLSDILITDYSSVFFDYANLKRPIIFFAQDLDRYRDNLRGFYFVCEEYAPISIVKMTKVVLSL